MNNNKTDIKALPTNIITGFLGVGKTSTILHLLKNKPANERWAVLVNEFGEIGVDGYLLEGQQPQENGVFISEVPGGCMCCAAGVPMQVALNQLLKSANPDRLLIEPTGLGHPKEVLEVLSSEHYQQVLSLEKILTLVDARNLSNERYTSHDTFNQQIEIADTIIGNKSDLYSDSDKATLDEYIKQKGAAHTNIILSQYGDIDFAELAGKTANTLIQEEEHHHHHHHSHHNKGSDKPLLSDVPIPECGFIKAENEGEGYHSIGWRFSSEKKFDKSKLVNFLWKTGAERVKAVFNTNNGFFGFNLDKDILSEVALESSEESRIEIISQNLDDAQRDSIEKTLMECIVD